MRERLTARVLMFDASDRILLMKGRLSFDSAGAGEWFTIGGGVEAGESLAQAARREIIEESGIQDFELGPVVWVRDLMFRDRNGEGLLFRENYLVARCLGGEPSRDGWDEAERKLIDDIRWWSLSDLRTLREPVHPQGLAEALPQILEGVYPDPPRILAAP